MWDAGETKGMCVKCVVRVGERFKVEALRC